MADLRATTLHGVYEQRVRQVILDCTGVEEMNDEAVQDLALTIDALLLLGTRTLICGVGAALARQLAANQIDRRAHHIASDLAHAIEFALAQREDAEQS
jgi:anti-anti-sigma regulatory factor